VSTIHINLTHDTLQPEQVPPRSYDVNGFLLIATRGLPLFRIRGVVCRRVPISRQTVYWPSGAASRDGATIWGSLDTPKFSAMYGELNASNLHRAVMSKSEQVKGH
jgi:hypothetical protein